MSEEMLTFARTHIAGRPFWAEERMPQGLMAAMSIAGLFRIGLPPEHGGTGGGYPAIAAAEGALMEAGGISGLGTVYGGHQAVARYFLHGFATPAQQARYLPALAAGASTVAVAISEPDVGAHPKRLTTTATRVGDGWSLTGRKAYVTNGPLADLFVVLAITAMVGERKRYSCFLVPRNAAGLIIHPAATPASMRPAGHVSLTLENCLVPAAALLGPEGEAYERMALGFRDVEDALGCSGQAGKLRHILAQLAAEQGAAAPDEVAAELGALAGLVALASEAATTLASHVEQARILEPHAQALTIGVRELSTELVRRIRALPVPPGVTRSERVEALLAGLEGGMRVARGPRTARMVKLGRGL